MGGISCEQESWVSSRTQIQDQETDQPHYQTDKDEVFCPETEDIWQKVSQTKANNNITSNNSLLKDRSNNNNNNRTSSSGCLARSKKKKNKKNQVLLEGYVGLNNDQDDLKRTKSLTDEDLDELKGCVDLGFGFSYDEIPELCNTLPALELCYSMSQKFLDEHHHKSPERAASPAAASPEASSGPVANWKISSPGDHPEDVKARLKFWAQAVACTVRLCS